MMGGMGGMGGSNVPASATFSSNGERIFYTGISSSGRPIGFNNGPMWLSMRGGSCVNCHGEDGRGGQPVMMGTAIPRDIRYGILTSDHSGGGDGHNHAPYTNALIKRAITKGIRPDGKALDRTMPRWQMSDKDLEEVIAYLKTLPVPREEIAKAESHQDGADGHVDGMVMGSDSDTGHGDGDDHSSMVMSESSSEQPSYILLLSLIAVDGATFGTGCYLKKREALVPLAILPAGEGSGEGKGQPDGV